MMVHVLFIFPISVFSYFRIFILVLHHIWIIRNPTARQKIISPQSQLVGRHDCLLKRFLYIWGESGREVDWTNPNEYNWVSLFHEQKGLIIARKHGHMYLNEFEWWLKELKVSEVTCSVHPHLRIPIPCLFFEDSILNSRCAIVAYWGCTCYQLVVEQFGVWLYIKRLYRLPCFMHVV